MTITDVRRDADTLTMTVTVELDAPVEHAWQLWEDPRQLERWWGPPTYPATFTEHELVAGGSARYFMTGPEGDKSRGWWRMIAVDAPRHLTFEDGFADDEGNPNPEMPTMTMDVELNEGANGTVMSITTQFPSREAMDRVLEMGMEEGMKEAMGQIDALLVA